MRVWFVHQHAYAPFHSAGTRHFELARQLVRRGHEPLIIASSFDHKTQQETRLAPGEPFRREVIDGAPYLWLRTPRYRGNGVARLWNMLSFTRSVARRVGLEHEPPPDVVIGSTPHLFAPLAALRLSKRFGVPFVLEIRDIWPDVLIEMGCLSPRHPLAFVLRRVERMCYRSASRILSVMPFAGEHVRDCIGRDDHVVWLPNGTRPPRMEPPTAPADDRTTFMYAGAHSHYGGLDMVLDAAAVLESIGWGERIRIRLVGDGPEKPRLRQRAESLGLTCLSFEPPVPKCRVFDTLQQADAFLLVYRESRVHQQYGLGANKLFDYLAAARPVICGVGSRNNAVEEAGAGISVPIDDPAALAQGMIRLAQLPLEERIAMGRRGRAYVDARHNFDHLGGILEQTLLDTLAASRPHGLDVAPSASSGFKMGVPNGGPGLRKASDPATQPQFLVLTRR